MKQKKQEGKFIAAIMPPMTASSIAFMASSLLQPVASSLINAIAGIRVRSARKGQKGGFLPLLVPPLMKVLENGDTRAGKEYNNMDHLDKNF